MSAVPKLVLCDFPATPDLPGWESFSPFVMKIDRALKLAKLPYERKLVAPIRIGKLNPTGQLPVLVVDGENVADSTRILHRIEKIAPGALTAGLDADRVAEAWLWEEFADVALYPYGLATRWLDERNWPEIRRRFFASIPAPIRGLAAPLVRRRVASSLVGRDFVRAGLDACWERMSAVLDDLDRRAPEQGFWLGPEATISDLSLFSQLHSLRIPYTPWQAGEVARRTRLSRFLDRVDQRTRT